jgi:hypothetical protein
MWRFIFLVTVFLVCLPVAQAMPVEESPWQGFSVLEDNKEIAFILESSLEALEGRVEALFENGGLSQEKWEEFKQLHWEAEAFLHLFIMANLYYEEAPVETYGHLVEVFGRDMVYRMLFLDRFCIEIGIEVIPYESV